ncbi:restriction endonuclease subunit S [Streptococcus suis]|uniref:restriction endonuclease subunit S n=1 Tax=Streptococcus suis TaxID=1307 RepID=UPI0038BD83EA
MTKEKSTVPRLRFPGFTDAWKQRKLGEVAEKISQKNLDRQYVETFTNSAEFGIISQRDFFEKNISSLDNISGYYIVSPDDFVYNPRISNLAPVGPIKRNKLGRVGVMSPLYTIFRFSDIHLDFVEKYFDTTIWHRYMELNGDSGARSDRFAIKDSVFKGLPIPLPTLPEQEAIGNFFSDLDQLITLHQRKLDDVKELKKALLQKMFPKGNGNDFPELRFPEFTDAWKQRKLGEVAVVVMGQSPDSKNYTNNPLDNILVQGNADLKNGNVEPRVWTTQITKIAEKGDIIVSVRAPVGDVAKTSYKVVLGRGVAGIKGNDFIYQTLIRMKQFGYWMKLSTGSTFESINSGDIKSSLIPLPTLPEQEAIGSFFSDLDQLITLHQRQLDHLKLLKKALLQQMFI